MTFDPVILLAMWPAWLALAVGLVFCVVEGRR